MARSGVCLVITRKGQERNKDGIRKFELSEKIMWESGKTRGDGVLCRSGHAPSGQRRAAPAVELFWITLRREQSKIGDGDREGR